MASLNVSNPSSSSGQKTEAGSSSPTYDTLTPTELEWCKRQPYLQRHGLELRSRYRPGWKPSWSDGGPNTGKDPKHCDDGPPHTAVSALSLSKNMQVSD